MDDSEDTPYSQQYLVATSTKSWAYQCPHNATQSPKTMSIWILYKYWRLFLTVFPLGGLAIVENEPILDGRRPKFTKLSLVPVVICFLLRHCLQPKMWWIFKDSNCVRFLHGAGVDNGGIGGTDGKRFYGVLV